jgi:hypothetical protein
MAVPVARLHNRLTACASFGKPRPLIPVSTKRHVEFRFQEFLDEAANAGPHPGFQGIEPIVPKEKRSFGCLHRRLYGIHFHGVISVGALTPIRFVEQCGDYATINFQPLLRRHQNADVDEYDGKL